MVELSQFTVLVCSRPFDPALMDYSAQRRRGRRLKVLGSVGCLQAGLLLCLKDTLNCRAQIHYNSLQYNKCVVQESAAQHTTCIYLSIERDIVQSSRTMQTLRRAQMPVSILTSSPKCPVLQINVRLYFQRSAWDCSLWRCTISRLYSGFISNQQIWTVWNPLSWDQSGKPKISCGTHWPLYRLQKSVALVTSVYWWWKKLYSFFFVYLNIFYLTTIYTSHPIALL